MNKEPRRLEIASGNAEVLLKNGNLNLEIPPNSLEFKKGMLFKIIPRATKVLLRETFQAEIPSKSELKEEEGMRNYLHRLARLEDRKIIAKVLDFKERDDGSNQVSLELQNFESN